MISLSSSNPAVASVPATATVPANSFTATFAISTSRSRRHDGHDHGGVQRHDENGDAHGHAAGSAAAPTLQSRHGPVDRRGRVEHAGLRDVVPGSPRRARRSRCRAATRRRQRAGERDRGGRGDDGEFTVTTRGQPRRPPAPSRRPTAARRGRRRLTVTPSAAAPQNVTLTVTATGRSGERVTSTPQDQRRHRHQRLGVVRTPAPRSRCASPTAATPSGRAPARAAATRRRPARSRSTAAFDGHRQRAVTREHRRRGSLVKGAFIEWMW